MDVQSVENIVSNWNAVGVRYLIAGGLAVVAHGYVRFTSDFDVMLDFDADNLRRADEVLQRLGYRPRVPASLQQLSDAETRRVWREERHMLVFSFYQERGSITEIDVFVRHPEPFELLCERATQLPLPNGSSMHCIGLEDWMQLQADTAYQTHALAQMKRAAQLTFAQKLQWLEDAHRFVLAMPQSKSASTCSAPQSGTTPTKDNQI